MKKITAVLLCSVLAFMLPFACAGSLPDEYLTKIQDRFHVELENTDILTRENCDDLAAILDLRHKNDELFEEFAEKYEHRLVEFYGCVLDEDWLVWNPSNFEVMLAGTSYENLKSKFTCFQFSNVSPEELGVDADDIRGRDLPSPYKKGDNIHVIGMVVGHNNEEPIMLYPLLVEKWNPKLDGVTIGEYNSLETGSKGDDVKALQQRLIDLKYLDDKADGSFGKKTKAAVEQFQKVHDLEVTGVAVATTQTILYSDDAKEATMSVSCSSIVIGSTGTTTWYVNGQEFTLKGNQTKTIETVWGTYKFDAFGNYEKVD